MSLLKAEEIRELPAGTVLLDARPGVAGREAYAAGHLPSALHIDLDRDLAAPPVPEGRGGRHPLPAPEVWGRLLGELGVGPETPVVVYDDQAGANAAARVWWMLRASGHSDVRVVDGGLRAALEAGLPLVTETVRPTARGPHPVPSSFSGVASLVEVEAALDDPATCVLDVRSAERFRGEVEPIDPVAGHLPGARNLPFTENLDPNGRFRSPEALRRIYASLVAEAPVDRWIVHCGSGVTACHTLLALDSAGLSGARLYVGSFSEWCRVRPDRIARE